MLQPRRYKYMGGIIASYLLLLVLVHSVLGNEKEAYRDYENGGSHLETEQISLDRIKRDNQGITTILLINNDDDRSGRSARPSGILTSTARTFVNDGTTTEFGTQIIGTTLNQGRYYAQLLQTSSRIYFADQDKVVTKSKPDERAFYKSRYIGLPQNVDNFIIPSVFYDIRPSEPVFIYPTKTVVTSSFSKQDGIAEPSAQNINSDSKLQQNENELLVAQSGNIRQFSPRVKENEERELLENLIRLEKVDLYNKRTVDGIKPSKVFSNLLPTVTIRHDFAPSGFSVTPDDKREETLLKSEKSKLRSGKSFLGKPVEKKYDTVTYLGFADFVTTVGNTVIVFMPNTRAGDQNVKSTSTAHETTSEKPEQEIMTTIKTFMSHSPGMVTKTIPGHGLSMQTTLPTTIAERKSKGLGEDMELKSSVLAKEQILFENPVFSSAPDSTEILIEPSESVTYSSISRSSHTATEPLATFATTVTRTFNNGGSDKPLGLLKSVGGTKAYNGTTTHFTSLIYGTYVDGSYAQILKTSSSVFYLLKSTGDVSATVFLNQFSTESHELPITTTPASNDEEELLETSEGDGDDSEENDKTTIADSITTEGTTDEKALQKPPEVNTEPDDISPLEVIQKSTEVLQTSTDELITRLVPSTVYKTFTYLTTFFIPADETTTTSIRSREVVTSDVNIVTKIIDPNLVSKEVFPTISLSPSKTNVIETEDVDLEFRLPSLRVLAPEEIIIIEDSEDNSGSSERDSITTSPESFTAKETEADTTVANILNSENINIHEPKIITSSEGTTNIPQSTLLEESENLITTTEELNDMQEPPKETETATAANETSDDEEIEVIFKTLYTTYTYLTTFFHESTTSISSSEVVVTNVITSTLSNSVEPTPRNLIEITSTQTEEIFKPTKIFDEETEEKEGDVAPTSVVTGGSETKFFDDDEIEPSSAEIPEQSVTETPVIQISGLKTLYTTYTYFTTLFDEGTTEVKSRTEVVTNVIGPNSVSILPPSILHNEALLKSKFEMLLREQQSQRAAAAAKSNVLTSSSAFKSSVRSSSSLHSSTQSGPSELAFQSGSTLFPSSTYPSKSNIEKNQSVRESSFLRFSIRPSSSRGRYGTITRKFKIPVSSTTSTSDLIPSEKEEDNSVTRSVIKGEKRDRTIIRKRIRTKSRLLSRTTNVDSNLGITTIRLDPTPIEEDRTLLQTMVTDIKTSSSGGGRQIRIAPPVPAEKISDFVYDDQISSESNTEEIEPSPTLILQTSYTTFTYFTTVYKGSSSSDVISRLETVTNIVTETVKPDLLATQNLSPEDATLPITYFTTFTYWTTLYKDGSTVITSREETVSNVVTPTIEPSATEIIAKTVSQFIPSQEITIRKNSESTEAPLVVSGFVPAATPESITEPVELETPSPINTKPIENLTEKIIGKDGFAEKFEPTTYYTTYTYFTTSYIGDSTVLKSRLETVTNVISATPTISDILENDLQTGRAINAGSANRVSKSEEIKENAENTVNALQTGLLSTVVSTAVNDGKTTLYSTDIFGTFIDGLYAKVLESTTKVVSEVDIAPSRSSEIQKTGVVSINEGKIIDADGISTTFFTTKAIGTSIEQLYAQVVESTSSVLVDNDKKSALASLQGESRSDDSLRTGLVRLIEGSIIKDGTTTLYESRVIGTVIDGRYAQIIESTSSYKIEPSIAPSVTIKTEVTSTSSIDITSPSPSAIEGSIVDEVKSQEEQEESESEDEEDEEDDDDKDKGRVKSRLTFQSRKRTFTPVIRPFASRNRPTFLPKKKTVGTTGAQTITRANFTPTITATPATKTEGFLGSSRNRFGSGRKSNSPVISPEVRATASVNNRKFGRNRSTFSSPTISSSYPPSRGRSSARISPTPTLNLSSTRGRGNFRGSSARPALNFETGTARSSLLPTRPRIRPTLSGLPGRGFASVSTESSHDKSNDLTTIITEEDDVFTADEEGVSVTTPTTTTTEDPNLARRHSNPLLRFRRPLVPRATTTTTTPKPASTQAPRRGILNSRNRQTTPQAVVTTPRGTNARSQNSFANRANIQGRPRPVNNLFPPRGLFKKPTPQETEKEEEDTIDDEEEEEIENEDNSYEETSAKEIEAEAENKKTEKSPRGKGLNPVSIRPFNFQRRSKRQVPEYGARNRQYSDTAPFTPRYRRPKVKVGQAQERFDYYDDEYLPSEAPKPLRNGRTYSPRSRTNTQVTNPPSQPRIRPTTASSQNSQRAPFTIREKDTNSNPRTTNFRRGQTSTSRRKTNYVGTEPTHTRKSSRGRTTAQNQALNDLTRNNQRRGYSNNRRISPSRSKSRFGDNEDSNTYQQSVFDGTITVTHKIPSEVSIPIVNGKITEYRNVITAKPSIEVLGPHQYTVSSTNGGTVLFLNREITETLNNGVTEVTRFLVRETPTTSITFTPTTIRGRKTSFSHIIPSTVYDVENIITTLQPQLAANAPLANILLSQLLLGNLNIPPNQPLGIPSPPTAITPTTEFKTRTTTYVTSVTDHISTVLPITFRGKEILTTIVDDTVNVITATEYITDTIVITPTVAQNQQINSLLLPALLQAQLLNSNQQVTPPQLPNPALMQLPFNSGLGLDQLKLEALQQQELKIEDLTDERSKLSKDNDIRLDRESDENVEEEKEEIKPQRSKFRKKGEKKRFEPEPAKEVITLYVSGRRPGEFSTILSTVISGETSAAVKKRETTALDDIERLLVEASEVKQVRVLASKELSLDDDFHKTQSSYFEYYVTPGTSDVNIPVASKEFNSETQSLESVLGDVSKHMSKATPTVKAFVKPTQKNSKKATTAESIDTESGRRLGMNQELRYNLATKVMRNGVEVIVATDRNPRPVEPEYLRHLSSTVTRPITLAPHTLTNLMSLVLPKDYSDDNQNHLISILKPSFVTRTYLTTYNYPMTILQANTTTVSNFKEIITNVKTEIYSKTKLPENNIQPTATQFISLNSSPTLQTEVFHTAYTYWNTLLDGEQPIVMSSTHTLSNTVVEPFRAENYLEPSEIFPTTNTYLKTVEFTKTLTDGTDFQIISTKDLVTQVVITDKPNKKVTNLPITTDVTKTYFVTYTYFSTYLDGDQTKVKSDVSVSSDVTIEKFYIKPKKTETKIIEPTSKGEVSVKFSSAAFPFNILGTKTYLTTFTYFTTLLQGPNSDNAEIKINSRTKTVESTITQTISLQDFNADYLVRLNSSLNKISGSLVTTATLKGGEKIKITAHKNLIISGSYLKYEIKPTKAALLAETKIGTYQTEKKEEVLAKTKPSLLISKTKNTFSHKSKIKPSKTLIREVTAEALIASEAEANSVSVTPTVTSALTTSSFTAENLSTDNPVTYSSITLTTSTAPLEEVSVNYNDKKVKDQLEQSSNVSETKESKKKPGLKQPTPPVNVSNLLNLNSLGINGMNVLGPVFNAMAELIHNNLNKNIDSLTRRNDTVAFVKESEQASKKPSFSNYNPLLNFVNKFTPTAAKGTSESKIKVTTPRTPVYIPVGSFAHDSEFGESQETEVAANLPDNWHEKWTDTHAKNFEKGRPHDPPITILEGGIPISPGQVITTNSDVIIGRPGETGPRPPTFAVKNNIPIDMKPPPLPPHVVLDGEEDDFVGQHSINQGVDFNFNQEKPNISPSRPPLLPLKKHPQEPHKNLRPPPGDRYKGSLHHKNPSTGKPTHPDYDSGTIDLNPPPVPPPPVRSHDVHRPITINHEQEDESDSHKTSNNILPVPVHLGTNQNVENYINSAEINPALLGLPTLPALGQINQKNIHHLFSEPTPSINTNPKSVLLIPTVEHMSLNLITTENSNLVDRSTGQQLLVNIQPSQVANIVIPHGSSTALILSDGKQHSLKGEVIDDPSPHPEPETVGFVGAEPVLKIESEDIPTSVHNDVIPAEAAKATHQNAQENHAPFSGRPHLTLELIKIRPKPTFNDVKEQNSQPLFFGHQLPDHLSLPTLENAYPVIPMNQNFAFIDSQRQAENHKNEDDSQMENFHLGGQNILKSPSGAHIIQNQNIQSLNFANEANKIYVGQNYRKEGPNINGAGANFLHHIREGNPQGVHLVQNQHKHHNHLSNTGGLHADQVKFNQGPNPVRGGNGIYIDISPPGHLPPRPNANLLHQSHSSNKQQVTINEHLLNHQSGLVHDVPLNAQVQLGTVQKKENPLKEILISSNTNKHDSIYDPIKKPSESQNNFKRPLPNLPGNLSPPPLNKEENYRIHRPLPFKSAHPITSVQRYPPHSHQSVPKPADFMMPPPKSSHRPNQKPHQELRPLIPIGAGAPQQNYINPRPEDIVIVPHKISNYVSNVNHEIRQEALDFSDLDVSDTSGPLKTEYGEEIQESISRPLFPGQLPTELQELNSTYGGYHHSQKHDNNPFKNKPNFDINQISKSKVNSSAAQISPDSEFNKEKVKDSLNASILWSADYHEQNPLYGALEAHEQTSEMNLTSHGSFFSFIKKPSGFVNSNNVEVPINGNRQKPSAFANHKELPNLANHKQQTSFGSNKISSDDKGISNIGLAGTGNIRIHTLGPSVLPSGFVKNKNAVVHKKPSAANSKLNINESDHESLAITTSNNNKVHSNPFDIESSQNDKSITKDDSYVFGLKNKPTKPTIDEKEISEQSNDKTFGVSKVPSGSSAHISAAVLGQNKLPNRQESHNDNYSSKDETSSTNQKYNTHGALDLKNKLSDIQKQEEASDTIKFDFDKIPSKYSSMINSGIHNLESGKPQRYPITDSAANQNVKINKRPSGFTAPKKEGNKVPGNVASGDIPPSTTGGVMATKSPPEQPDVNNAHSGGPTKVSSGFVSKNETDHSFDIVSNHNYGNKSTQFYEPKPIFDVNEEHDSAYTKTENNADQWFASNFRGGGGNVDFNFKGVNKITHRNMSSLPNKVLPPDSDVHISLLTPPKVNEGRPKPEDVMGLSPPPLERPRRPQTHRPKPPFKFEIPTTSKSTVIPIAVENDFPPVRSPEFNRKPLKPQDIFPPRLPDNFIHHIPEFPIRNHPKPRPQERPVTSMPIDTPGDSNTEKNIYSIDAEENNDRDTYFAGSEINGHSKPIIDAEPNLSSMRPPPPPSNNNKVKPVSHSKPSVVNKQPLKIKTSERLHSEISSSKHKLPVAVEREEISPTSTLSPIVKTTFHTKVSALVTPTAVQTLKDWQYADIIVGSETIFDPSKFSHYETPTIHDFKSKKNILTTLISTGSTTIFGDLYTLGLKQIPEGTLKPDASSTVSQKENLKDDATEFLTQKTILVPTKISLPAHTTTLTVTTTMTTVVHSNGHKPLTKTVVLTKTLISTVINKITETKTLVKPTTATVIQTHTIATTKTALVVPTALYPTQTKYPAGGTLKPEIFMADPHAKDTMTISVSSSMNKNKHGEEKRKPGGMRTDQSDKESILVFVADKHPDINLSTDDNNNIDVMNEEDNDINESRVVMGGVLGANGEEKYKEKNKKMECTPGCKAKRNELCQRIEGVMKCMCRPGFARMFPDRPCKPTYTYNVLLMLEKFGSEQIIHEKNFVQSTSPNMAKLASATKEGLDRMIMQSDLRDIYHGIMLNGFQGKGRKTIVDFYVQLSENTDEAKLMETLKKTLQSNNYSLGGTELFASRESDGLYAEDFNECLNSKFHDCSENARCFNLKGTYTCSCKEGYTDLSENSQFPGRVCSDTIGCEYCGYHGACYSKGEDQITCECFQWYSGERCHINLKVLLIALVTIGAILLALLLVCAVMTCLNRRSRSSTASRTNGSSAGYLRYRGPSNQSLDRKAMIGDSSSESSVDNLPYICSPAMPSFERGLKKKPVLRHAKGPAPRPVPSSGMEQRDRSVTVMIPRAKYRPMPPLSPHLTMSTFSPDKHLSKTAAQIATEQKLINYLDGNSREDRTLVSAVQNNRQTKEQQKNSEYKTSSANTAGSPKPTEKKKDSKVFEYEYKISNMLFTEETNSADKRSFKSLDDRFRRHSDSTHLNNDSNKNQFRKYSAGALVSAGYEVSAKVGMHHLEEDTTEDEHSAIINAHTMKSNRSQFTTLNRVGDHKTMSEARSYDETTVHPSTRSLKTHYSGSSPSSRVNNDEGHTMIERDLGSTFIMPESQLFKPEADRGSDLSNFDSL